MKIRELLRQEQTSLSFEVFPPKKDTDFANVETATLGIAKLQPSYMSVTYGAGGSTKGNTIQLASEIQQKYNVPAISHLTCVCASKENIKAALNEMKSAGIENILALRGDLPNNFEGEVFTDFAHASELVAFIKENGDFCVGGACYPEVHPDSPTKADDLEGLQRKVEAGCEYLTTQMFFDNNIFFNFMIPRKRSRNHRSDHPGYHADHQTRSGKECSVKLSGCNVPERFKNIVDRFGDNEAAMKQAGIAYATDQIIDSGRANGVKHIHVYSMNKPENMPQVSRQICQRY